MKRKKAVKSRNTDEDYQQLTNFVKHKVDIQFAIDQLEKYKSKYELGYDKSRWVAVFVPPIPRVDRYEGKS